MVMACVQWSTSPAPRTRGIPQFSTQLGPCSVEAGMNSDGWSSDSIIFTPTKSPTDYPSLPFVRQHAASSEQSFSFETDVETDEEEDEEEYEEDGRETDEEFVEETKPELKFESEPCTPKKLVDAHSVSMQSSNPPKSPSMEAVEPVKKRRGRPPKNSVARKPPPPKSTRPKRTFQRCKTGCVSCRARKKKCDEQKPSCRNCQKNNIICGGYDPKKDMSKEKLQTSTDQKPIIQNILQLWLVPYSHKQAQDRKLPITDLCPLPFNVFPAFETNEDLELFRHFGDRISQILTVQTEDNPFVQLIMPMASSHKGLMHSILGLSASHLCRLKPRKEYEKRRNVHCHDAIKIMAEDVGKAMDHNADVEDPIAACMILQCLIPVTAGATNGQHRMHLDAARRYIKFRTDEQFGKFAQDFNTFYNMSDAMTSLNNLNEYRNEGAGSQPGHALSEESAFGIWDGLSVLIMEINQIRNEIRNRKTKDGSPSTSYDTIKQSSYTAQKLHDWKSNLEENTSKWVIAEVYRQTALVYLHRSVRASKPDPDLSIRVERGLYFIGSLVREGAIQCLLLPTFILGCSAFEEGQRMQVREILTQLEACTRQGNVAPTLEVIQKVWEMMDVGDEQNWDWESVMYDMGIDISIT